MQPPFQFELDWIAALQTHGSLQRVMVWFSYLGSEACIAILPVVYLALSRAAGERIFLLYSAGSALQQILKLVFHVPRPFWIDARIKALSESGGFGLPSGHAQMSTIIWPYVARTLGMWWPWLAAVATILAVSLSRMYLGVHSFSDVVTGWVIGAGWLALFISQERKLLRWFDATRFWGRMGWIGVAAVVFLAIGIAARPPLAEVPDSPALAKAIAEAHKLSSLFRSVGLFVGAAAGILLARRWARFEVGGPWWRRGVAVGTALAVAWVCHKLSKKASPLTVETLQCSLNFLYGALVNLWLVFVAPWILLKVNLLRPPDSEAAKPRGGDKGEAAA